VGGRLVKVGSGVRVAVGVRGAAVGEALVGKGVGVRTSLVLVGFRVAVGGRGVWVVEGVAVKVRVNAFVEVGVQAGVAEDADAGGGVSSCAAGVAVAGTAGWLVAVAATKEGEVGTGVCSSAISSGSGSFSCVAWSRAASPISPRLRETGRMPRRSAE